MSLALPIKTQHRRNPTEVADTPLQPCKDFHKSARSIPYHLIHLIHLYFSNKLTTVAQTYSRRSLQSQIHYNHRNNVNRTSPYFHPAKHHRFSPKDNRGNRSLNRQKILPRPQCRHNFMGTPPPRTRSRALYTRPPVSFRAPSY